MRFLFTTYEGGGHVPPALLVARRLAERGHAVLFVSDEANRAEAEAAGLAFQPWRRAPNRSRIGGADDPMDDWRSRWPPAVVRRICDAAICGPAAAYAADALETIRAFAPDAVVTNELLFGVMAAAEAAAVPLALLTGNVWCFPTRADVPPFGPGFAPGGGRFAQGRDAATRRMIAGWYDAGLADLNAARGSLGLAPLGRTLDQLRAPGLVLLGASAAFDFGADPPPAPFAYAGPLGEMPSWAAQAPPPDLIDPDRPNVLVSFSTTYQGQERAVARCVAALAALPVRGIVTLGPALRVEATPAAPNVKVVARASHDALVPHCRAMICHGGHGTVLRPLMHGVPVICLPMGRDQPENAQRIASRGAGLRLGRDAGAGRIRRAVRRVLGTPAFAERARALGAAVRAEADGGRRAAELLERFAGRGA